MKDKKIILRYEAKTSAMSKLIQMSWDIEKHGKTKLQYNLIVLLKI